MPDSTRSAAVWSEPSGRLRRWFGTRAQSGADADELRDTLDGCCRVELDAHGEVLGWEKR